MSSSSCEDRFRPEVRLAPIPTLQRPYWLQGRQDFRQRPAVKDLFVARSRVTCKEYEEKLAKLAENKSLRDARLKLLSWVQSELIRRIRIVEGNGLALFLVGIIGLVLMFAQLKLFSIDASLKRIVELLESKKSGATSRSD